MAFTLSQRQKIRTYLGWSGRYFQTDSQLEMAMNAVAAETEASILAELNSCEEVDAALKEARDLFGVQRSGSIGLSSPEAVELLRGQGRQAAGRIAAMLGVEIRHDAFAPGGPAGPTGNYIRHG